MHSKNIPQFLIPFIFIGLTYCYYQFNFGGENTDKVFITITTFFFSIFTSFFITRQGNRYTKLREIISTYDGKLSGAYRVAGNLSPEVQSEIGTIVKDHYQKIIDTKSWDYHFVNKSNTISGIHDVLEKYIGGNKQETLRNQSVGRILANLGDCQVLRKNMVTLSQEKIPYFQWAMILIFLVIFLVILLATITVIPSVGFLLGAALKAAFVVAIISVLLILHNLDNLHLFENFIGENSAIDVLNTIKGVK